MAPADVDLLWRVEVEMPHWHGWHPLELHRLRRILEANREVLRVRKVWPWLQRPLRRHIAPTVIVEVAADSPRTAGAAAERAVGHALSELGRPSDVSAWIISTDGDLPPRAR